MFGHRSFLVLDGEAAADIVSLVQGGLEILHCTYSFQQGVDDRGKATTRVHGGDINIVLAQLPPRYITKWALGSREYKNGAIITLDSSNMPVERVIFQNAACVGMDINYSETGSSYASTQLSITTEEMNVADGVDFLNEWTF